MSTENKKTVELFLKAFGRGDGAAIGALVAPDARAVCTGTGLMSGDRDHAGIVASAAMLGQMTKAGVAFEILSLTAEEDRVSCEAIGRSTLVNGATYDNEYHFLFTIRDGAVVGIREYMDTMLIEKVFGPLVAASASAASTSAA